MKYYLLILLEKYKCLSLLIHVYSRQNMKGVTTMTEGVTTITKAMTTIMKEVTTSRSLTKMGYLSKS